MTFSRLDDIAENDEEAYSSEVEKLASTKSDEVRHSLESVYPCNTDASLDQWDPKFDFSVARQQILVGTLSNSRIRKLTEPCTTDDEESNAYNGRAVFSRDRAARTNEIARRHFRFARSDWCRSSRWSVLARYLSRLTDTVTRQLVDTMRSGFSSFRRRRDLRLPRRRTR